MENDFDIFDTAGDCNISNCPPRCYKMVFTINNYTENDLTLMTRFFSKLKHANWVYGFECGKKKEVPHVQGAFTVKNALHFSSIKKSFPRAWLATMIKPWIANWKYCTKEGKWKSNWEPPRSIEEQILEKHYKDVVWREWQMEIIDLINQEPDARTIHWIWSSAGNKGKSFVLKYLCLKYDCIIASGKTNDIFNQLKVWREANKDKLAPDFILIDVPRSEFHHVNYSALESIKNGFVYSGKYEGGRIVLDHCHVIVCANSLPNDDMMSVDRFKVKRVD